MRQSHPWDRWLVRFPKENHAAASHRNHNSARNTRKPSRDECPSTYQGDGDVRINAGRQLPTRPIVHPNNLGGRENTKFDHLDKTKDLSASSARQSRATLCFPAPDGRQTLQSALTQSTLPRIPRISRTISVGRLRPRRQPRQQLEHVPGGSSDTQGTLPRIPRISRTISVGRVRPRRQSRQQLEHVPGGRQATPKAPYHAYHAYHAPFPSAA